jgi:uncharacterized membrane protein YbaN (DUF454 family)
MKKTLYFILGLVLLGVSYLGWILPGIPFSIPAVFAAICFAKSNDRLHKWMMNHPKFGPFVNNWSEKKVFPTKMKYVMLAVMAMTLLFIAISTGNVKAVVYSGLFMIFGATWGWRYPGSPEEYASRVAANRKIGWLK